MNKKVTSRWSIFSCYSVILIFYLFNVFKYLINDFSIIKFLNNYSESYINNILLFVILFAITFISIIKLNKSQKIWR